jgi:hypothetical protein
MDVEEKNIMERVKARTTRNFTVNGCPEDVFVKFTKYASQHTSDCYWMAIKELLELAEGNTKELVLFGKLQELEDRMVAIESKPTERKKPRTMGKKED